jgi:hypothetical protein
MPDARNKIDPELLQARWVLGGLAPDELVDQAVLALEQGFDGTALRQLAGLAKPTLRDLGMLPARAFAEMGLPECHQDQAATLLVERQARSVVKVLLSQTDAEQEASRLNKLNADKHCVYFYCTSRLVEQNH